MKRSAECISDQVKKLETLYERFGCKGDRCQRLDEIVRSKYSRLVVCKKYVSLTISSAPVPRCGNRSSDRSRKSEVIHSEKCEEDRFENKERNSGDKSRDNVEITRISRKGGIYAVGVPRKSGGT